MTKEKATESERVTCPAQFRELIGLAVSAQIPCVYCVYFHTKAAKKFGASDAEIKEALAQAGQVRKRMSHAGGESDPTSQKQTQRWQQERHHGMWHLSLRQAEMLLRR